MDLTAYKDELMARFANQSVKDTLARLAAESSDRIPTWLVPVIKENLAAGRDVTASAAIVASWARYAEGTGENGEEWPVVDRLHDRVMAAAARHDHDLLAFLRDDELFGDLVEHAAFTTPDLHALEVLRAHRAGALLQDLVASARAKPAPPARWVRALRRHRPARQASGLPNLPARRAPGSGLAAPTPGPRLPAPGRRPTELCEVVAMGSRTHHLAELAPAGPVRPTELCELVAMGPRTHHFADVDCEEARW